MDKPNHIITGKMRELSLKDIYTRQQPRIYRSSLILPSQYQSYAICTEFAKEWFLEKFANNFFNSIFVEGKHSFDEFRKFSSIDEKLKRINPILAIVPAIDVAHNRNWVDSTPEMPMLLRRSRFDGTFFNDVKACNSLHLQVIFQTILMNFTYKMRVNTRAEQLDLFNFIKIKHRAGYSETRELALDVHVPKEIIAQIACDNGFKVDSQLNVDKPLNLLKYLNAHSYIPFVYKLRYSNGNNEFFIKVPNCVAHIKSELPNIDEGERQNTITTNYTIEFNVEIEMTAPYAFTYFSQCEQKYLNITGKEVNVDCGISVLRAVKTDIPQYDEHIWKLLLTTEYLVEEEDIGTEISIDLNGLFAGTDLEKIINHTKSIGINPSIFINIKLFNNGLERCFTLDWKTLTCKITGPIDNITTVIALYCDVEYINNTLAQLKDLESSRLH